VLARNVFDDVYARQKPETENLPRGNTSTKYSIIVCDYRRSIWRNNDDNVTVSETGTSYVFSVRNERADGFSRREILFSKDGELRPYEANG